MTPFEKQIANLLNIELLNIEEKQVKKQIITEIKRLKEIDIQYSWVENPERMGR